MIEKLPFGRTGHHSTRTIFGGVALKQATQAEADRALDVLLEYGIFSAQPPAADVEQLVARYEMKPLFV